MSGGPSLLTTLISALSTFLAFAVEIALLVVALSYVKPRRPDAAMALVIGAVLHLIPTVLWPIVTSFVMPAMASEFGGSISAVISVFTLLFTVTRTLGWAAIIFAVIKLASPPGGPPRDPTRYT